MKIVEHKNIKLNNLISYNTEVKHSDILKLTQYISDNLHVLNLKKNANIIFTEKDCSNNDKVNVEILIPVKGIVNECNEYGYKPIFKLNNAIVIRHEGSFRTLHKTEAVLNNFIMEHNLKILKGPYYVVIRNDTHNSYNCIIDVCISIERIALKCVK